MLVSNDWHEEWEFIKYKKFIFLAEVISVFLSPWITPALHLLPRFFVRNEGKVRSFEMK